MKLSIIIPLYESQKEDVYGFLNSIYSQSIPESSFEVICVDDFSPSNGVKDIVTSYKYLSHKPSNLIFYRQNHNTRQGGARNTGINMAKGNYILFIDQDDLFCPGCLHKIISECSGEIDMVMYDFSLANKDTIIKKSHYGEKESPQTTGVDFILHNEISWMPWSYLYKRDFLIENKFKFVENVRFEDVDFVLECIANAKVFKFVPLPTIIHRDTGENTSRVGNNQSLNIDLVKIAHRVGCLAERLKENKNGCWNIVLKHHDFMYDICLKKYIWRLKPNNLYQTIKQFPPTSLTIKKHLRLTKNYPNIVGTTLLVGSPFMHLAYYFYGFIKNKK